MLIVLFLGGIIIYYIIYNGKTQIWKFAKDITRTRKVQMKNRENTRCENFMVYIIISNDFFKLLFVAMSLHVLS